MAAAARKEEFPWLSLLPDESVGQFVDLDREAVVGQGADDEVRDGREVGAALPIHEEVHVAARTVAHAMSADGIASGERKAVVAAPRPAVRSRRGADGVDPCRHPMRRSPRSWGA